MKLTIWRCIPGCLFMCVLLRGTLTCPEDLHPQVSCQSADSSTSGSTNVHKSACSCSNSHLLKSQHISRAYLTEVSLSVSHCNSRSICYLTQDLSSGAMPVTVPPSSRQRPSFSLFAFPSFLTVWTQTQKTTPRCFIRYLGNCAGGQAMYAYSLTRLRTYVSFDRR